LVVKEFRTDGFVDPNGFYYVEPLCLGGNDAVPKLMNAAEHMMDQVKDCEWFRCFGARQSGKTTAL